MCYVNDHRQKQSYGSVDNKTGGNSSLKVIYCVHGKPSTGCCTVTVKDGDTSKATANNEINNAQTANLSIY